MGRDLTLHPGKASKKELASYLKRLGFVKCDHLWDWPEGTLNFHWFDSHEFRSITGVEADVFPVKGDELLIAGNPWALHVRNTYSASWHDVWMLNEVLRGARKQFGGTIEGDYGTNRYAPLWEDASTPIGRGLSAAYQRVSCSISEVKYSLPASQIEKRNINNNEIIDFVNSNDPMRVLYNGLVPFAVAMFEFFFAEAFEILLEFDQEAQIKKTNYRQKVDFSVLVEVANSERTIENVIASNYTFQNLNQLNKAYKDWLGIDVRKVLYKKKKVGNSISFLENRISEIIQYRHGIVHGFEIDRSLNQEKYEAILTAIEMAIGEFIGFVEKKYDVIVERY
ncbi:MAG: hypothetical protein ABJQ71_01175 [Roseibium sp.]